MRVAKKTPIYDLVPGVNFPVALAPMVGLSHVGFRWLLKQYLPKGLETLWTTEMLNTQKIPRQDLDTHAMSLKHSDEGPLWPQILGNNEKKIAASVAKLEDWGAKAFDINMGCPVKKALRHNYGVSLMGDIGYASQVVRWTAENTDLPVSVKLRSGFKNDIGYLEDFVGSLAHSGADWITLHPRFAEEKRRGKANWDLVAQLKKSLSVPIIGNGDIQTSNDVFEKIDTTHCDMVLVGRALTARPWLFWQVAEELGYSAPERFSGGRAPRTPSEEAYAYGEALLLLLDSLEQFYESTFGIVRFRFFVKTGHVWLNFGHSLMAKLHNVKEYDEARSVVSAFFRNSGLVMAAKTQLRQ